MVRALLALSTLLSLSAARVLRQASYGVDNEATFQRPDEASPGYYFPESAPDITKDAYSGGNTVAGPSPDWRPDTPPPPPSAGYLPNRELYTAVPQIPDDDYPEPEWETGESRSTVAPTATTERPWWETTSTTTERPWWETTTTSTERPWWETTAPPETTTQRPWWETSTTERPWWETSTTTSTPWWETTTTTTQRPWWETSTTALPWWLTSSTTARPPTRYWIRQREQQAVKKTLLRLPIPRRSPPRGGCKMLNPIGDGRAHPDNDHTCMQGGVVQSGCSCRYLRGENDENGCALYFLTLCSRH